jgi:PAS domain S-box-containing protein
VKPISILLLEDSALDALLVEKLLTNDNIPFRMDRVETRDAFRQAINEKDYDLILADYQLPSFDGFSALAMKQEAAVDAPFIFVSGTLGEELAIDALHRGATDYVLKQRIDRLIPVIHRALKESQSREERARIEIRLNESEERFRRIVESARDYAIFTLDAAGMVTSWNEGARMLLGYAEEEILGHAGEILFTPEDRERGIPAAEMRGALSETAAETERWYCRRDGSRFWGSGRMMPLRQQDGSFRGFLMILRDRTEQREAEESLHEASRRKDQFLVMLAHELRNPLAPIRTASHALKRHLPEDPLVDEISALIERQVEHLTLLVDDLLDVARITRGRITIRKESVDLAAIVGHHLEDAAASFQERGIELASDLPADPVWVYGDSTRLIQVLGNLLDNAAKFTDAGGKVTVSLQPGDESEVVLRITDTGIGMDQKAIDSIFDVFQQADQGLERSRGGLGLGLSLARHLVELHGGEISAASDGKGCGSTFTIRLPLTMKRPSATAEKDDDARGGSGHRILIVEDNPDAAESLRLLLKMYGYDVVVAHNGHDGLRAAQHLAPDIVLCDLGIPGIDGFAVASALRKHPATASARLIAVTGYGQEEFRRRALDSGFDEHLVKPVDPLKLLGRIQQGMDGDGHAPQ